MTRVDHSVLRSSLKPVHGERVFHLAYENRRGDLVPYCGTALVGGDAWWVVVPIAEAYEAVGNHEARRCRRCWA